MPTRAPTRASGGVFVSIVRTLFELTTDKDTIGTMPRKASTTTKPSATLKAVPSATEKKGPMTFTAIPIKREDMPAKSKRGGRASNVPAIEAFLSGVTEPGVTYEMGSPDEDGGHPVNRVAQVKKVAGEKFKVETSPIESGKRYRIFVTLAS